MLFGLILATAASSVVAGIPDALLCGVAAVFIIHSGVSEGEVWYFQIFASQNTYVKFDKNGNFYQGGGHYESRKLCIGKSLKQLKAENRSFQFMTTMKDPLQFNNPQEYEGLKERWYKQFKSRLLREIQVEGLRIGGRWHILAQNTNQQYFVVRDVAGSKAKDSRLTLYPNSFVDLK